MEDCTVRHLDVVRPFSGLTKFCNLMLYMFKVCAECCMLSDVTSFSIVQYFIL